MHNVEEVFAAIDRFTADGFCLCEMIVDDAGEAVDYRFLRVNARFEQFTGLEDAEGRTAMELVPGLERHWIEAYARVGLGGESLTFENGSVPMGRWFEVHATPVEPHGRLAILFRDASERKRAETERAEALEQSRRLLEELNHRVKNSLALIASIIGLEARTADAVTRATLGRLRSRVGAVAELYSALDSAGSIETVDAEAYLGRLTDALRTSVSDPRHIVIECRADPVPLDSRQAVVVGLATNELVTNSLKHAFPGGAPGRIAVSLSLQDGNLSLEVADSGSGTHEDGGSGVGSRLVEAFARDLDGALDVARGPDGTRTRLTFALGRREAPVSA